MAPHATAFQQLFASFLLDTNGVAWLSLVWLSRGARQAPFVGPSRSSCRFSTSLRSFQIGPPSHNPELDTENTHTIW